MSQECEIKITCYLYKEIFYNDDNSFGIMAFTTKDELPFVTRECKDANTQEIIHVFTGKGRMAKPSLGIPYTLKGEYIVDPKYGDQIEITSLDTIKEFNEERTRKFLATLKLGNKQLESIMGSYPNLINDVIKNPLIEIPRMKYIGEHSAQLIKDKILANYKYGDIISVLAGYGISLAAAQSIYKQTNSVDLLEKEIKANPYKLSELKGFGFLKTDKFALKMYPDLLYSQERCISAMRYLLENTAEQDGDTYISGKEFGLVLMDLVPECAHQYKNILANIISDQNNKRYNDFYVDEERKTIGLTKYHNNETLIWQQLNIMQENQNQWYSDGIVDQRIQNAEDLGGFIFTEEQKSFIKSVNTNNVNVLIGKAGCVDCDTEFFDGTKWKRIADYQEGDKVAICRPDVGLMTFIEPENFIKKPCSKFYHIHSENLDQILSSDHICTLYHGYKDMNFNEAIQCNYEEITCEELVKRISNSTECIGQTMAMEHEFYSPKYVDYPTLDGIEEVDSKDGYKYCFTVPSHYFFIRCNGKISVIHNCGKSFSLKGIYEVYGDKKIASCALAAKAARRIVEATGREGASTIHMLLGYGQKGFAYNQHNKLDIDLLILDEAGMVNVDLICALLQALPVDAKIIIVGDTGQLPPIGAGSFLRDITEHYEYFNITTLTKIHRQAEKSAIITDANIIRDGLSPIEEFSQKIVHGELKDMFYKFMPDNKLIFNAVINTYRYLLGRGISPNDIAILTPMKEGLNSTSSYNTVIQDLLLHNETDCMEITGKTFKLGDRVIQCENNYDLNVMNGESGVITKIYKSDNNIATNFDVEFPDYSRPNGTKTITFDKKDMMDMELSYSLTIHKTQGSGIKYVIVVIDTSHYVMLDRTILYTGITRAKTECYLIGMPTAFTTCLTNNRVDSRKTYLSLF